ncbi:MAG: hypothetical protein AAFY11_12525 [Cyanobacteria bacterium J06641_5]
MNAAEQAYTPALASKIAQIALGFQEEFPDAEADLTPWLQDTDTRARVDPDSVDFGFHFPGRKPDCQSRSILVEIRFSDALLVRAARIIGIEISGYDHRGQQWRLSTVGDWNCGGENLPTPYAQERLKRFCQVAFKLFQRPSLPASSSNKSISEESAPDSILDPNSNADSNDGLGL